MKDGQPPLCGLLALCQYRNGPDPDTYALAVPDDHVRQARAGKVVTVAESYDGWNKWVLFLSASPF